MVVRKKQFELNFYDLYKITNKQLLKFVLSLYTDFTTSYDIRFQLNNGINLIDYLMNLWLASGKDKKIGNKSHKLYNFLSDIFKDEYYQNYLKKLIPNFKKMEDSYDKKLHFDFYYLRNEFCHGGLLIEDKELALRIVNNIFVLNEIIRMLIKNLNKIPLKSLKKYRTIPVTDNMEHCINYRIKLFNKRGSD